MANQNTCDLEKITRSKMLLLICGSWIGCILSVVLQPVFHCDNKKAALHQIFLSTRNKVRGIVMYVCQTRKAWSEAIGSKIPLPPIVTKALDRLQRRCNGAYKTLTQYSANSQNILVGLPAEIIIEIAKSCDPVSRLLLSLSSKRLRVILTEHLDLSLDSHEQKLTLLRQLEVDLPDYLTCRGCAWMYRWKFQKKNGFQCPRGTDKYHKSSCRDVCCRHTSKIRRAVVDLILRACQRGPNHGLSVDYISHNCHELRYVHGSIWSESSLEGEVYDGEFVVVRSWIFYGYLRDFYLTPTALVRDSICEHTFEQVPHICDLAATVEDYPYNYTDIQTLYKARCTVCATEIRCRMRPMANGMVQVVVGVWQNHGDIWRNQREISNRLRKCNAKPDNSARDLIDDYECDFWQEYYEYIWKDREEKELERRRRYDL